VQNEKKPAPPLAKLPLYVRLGFGAIVLFGMVGNCAGHTQGAVAVFVLTATLWACSRIIQEAIEAWMILGLLKKSETDDKKDDPPPPPTET